jgi:anhydro-N-acetylmuramic acid kinase
VPEFYIGLISGTSRDGIEAALAVAEGPLGWTVQAHVHHPYPPSLATELERLTLAGSGRHVELGQLDAAIGEAFADAALALLREAGVDRASVRAIGSHGQTLFHGPDATPPFTWQIGDPFRIAERTGIDTVALFRQRDMAAGGEGAPLACALHAACFSHPEITRAVINIGGISNITWLCPGQPVLGYDCGPGNTLMDGWIRSRRGLPYDAEGRWSAQGQVLETLLAHLRADPFFSLPPPKTTGPEYFSPEWLGRHLPQGIGTEAGADVQATLTELTATVIADAVRARLREGEVCEVLICGGGARNTDLMRRLGHHLRDIPLAETGSLGLPADQVEAAAFAWLARQTLHSRAGNLPAVTGARGPRILGCLIPGKPPAD